MGSTFGGAGGGEVERVRWRSRRVGGVEGAIWLRSSFSTALSVRGAGLRFLAGGAGLKEAVEVPGAFWRDWTSQGSLRGILFEAVERLWES